MKVLVKNAFRLLLVAALVGLGGQFQSCKKDDPDDNPSPSGPSHVSNLVENSGWTTKSYSKNYFTNNKYSEIAPYIPAFWESTDAVIGPIGPMFLARQTRQNWITDPTYSYQVMLLEDDTLLNYESTFPYGPVLLQAPANLLDYGLQPDFTYYRYYKNYNCFFDNGKVYGTSDIESSLNTIIRSHIRFISEDGINDFGWFNYLNRNSVSSEYLLLPNESVEVKVPGNIVLTELNNQKAMVYGGRFYSSAKEENVHCMVAKYWSEATDSLDLVSVINHNGELYDDNYTAYKSCKVGRKILTSISISLGQDLSLVFGDFNTGFSVIKTGLTGVPYLIEGDNEAFVLFSDQNGLVNVLKVEETGQVTTVIEGADLSNIFQYLNFAVYKGNLILAAWDRDAQFGVYKATSSGFQAMNVPNLLESIYLTGSVYVVANDDELYAVIQNCVSPVYVDEDDFQYCGWELIKFND